MSNNNKVVKYRRRKKLNIGIIIFLILFTYIVINVFMYFTKDRISIYEVKEGSNSVDNIFTGLILRNEEIYYSNQAGFISYYQKEGARVSKNSDIYSVDNDRQIYDYIMSGEVPISISKENHKEIMYEINKFKKTFTNENYSNVYAFNESAQSKVMDLLQATIMENAQNIQEETGIANSALMNMVHNSGIVSYNIDNYEHVKVENISKDHFDQENYQRVSLRTAEALTEKSPIFKLITSDEWSLAFQITDEQEKFLNEKNKITLTVLKDNVKITASIDIIDKGTESYAILKMDKYMTNYLSDRFLEIELKFNVVEGLKIPVTSVIEKEFYIVPLEYFTVGGDSQKKGLSKEVYSDVGEISHVFVPADIYYEDETYGYVDASLFEDNQWVQSAKSSNRYKLLDKRKLTGVYNVNLGYAVFKRIEILLSNKDYYIINKNTPYGLSLYDHIALDGNTIIEQNVIY